MAKKQTGVDNGDSGQETRVDTQPAVETSAQAEAPARAEPMRLRMPEGITAASFQGVTLEVRDGTVTTADHRVAEHLREAFGAVDVSHA